MKGFKSFLMQGELVVIAVASWSRWPSVRSSRRFLTTSSRRDQLLRGRRLVGQGTRLDAERPAHRHGRLHLSDRLLRGLHGRGLLRHRRALSPLHAAARDDGLRCTGAVQDLSSCLSAGLPSPPRSASSARATFPSNSRRAARQVQPSRDNFSNAGNAISKRFRSAGLSRSSRELSPMCVHSKAR